ncbi:hypothetical protein [Lactiplantibacillus plantarum]|uniref:hypothetical protein n=1 Tax=Lactiplantibacillus plantarum TaxID=1590 RepID=UPI004045E044
MLREALCHADLFLPSMDDMQHLTGNDDPERTLDWIRDAGATGVVVLKLGKDGSIIDDGKTRAPVAALRGPVVRQRRPSPARNRRGHRAHRLRAGLRAVVPDEPSAGVRAGRKAV